MRKLLNAKFVADVKPTSVIQEFSDSGTDNLHFIVYPSGKKVWRWRGRIDGKTAVITLGSWLSKTNGMQYADAIKAVSEIESARQAGAPIPYLKTKQKVAEPGVNVAVEESAAPTKPEIVKDVDWLWKLYVQKEGPTLAARTLEERERCYKKHIGPAIGTKSIFEVHRTDLVKILREKEEAGYGALSNNLCAYIRRLFRWAVTSGYDLTGLEVDPAANLIKLAPPSERDRFLDDDEIKFFFRSLPVLEETFAEVLMIALYTGMRRSEVFGLKWSEVKLHIPAIDIPKDRIKNGLPLYLPIPTTVTDILTARKKRTGNYTYVWPAVRSWASEPEMDEEGREIDETKVTNNFSRPMRRLIAECQRLAKLEGRTMKPYTIHDLRRTLSTGMHGLKGPDKKALVPTDHVERVINHVIGGVRGTYNRHDYQVEKQEALSHWAQHLDKIRLAADEANRKAQTEASGSRSSSPAGG